MSNREYKIHPDYRNSRPVNYNRWSNSKNVDDLVAEIMTDFPDSREPSGYIFNMKVLVLDLFESLYYDPEQKLSYYRDHNHYDFKLTKGKSNRYAQCPFVSATFFVGAVNHLIKNEYVHDSPGGHFVDDNGNYINSFLPRLLSTKKFADICAKYALTIDMVGKFTENELIILKGVRPEKVKGEKRGKAKLIDYDEETFTTKMRKAIRAYNSLLDNTYIDIDVECISGDDMGAILESLQRQEETVQDPEYIVKLSSCNVFRVFNNRSWEQGGRFYGAFWIGCPSVLRQYITLNGNPTVELDYSGIHIQLLYALKGINYAALKQDAYTLEDGIRDRELNKRIMLTAINATGIAKTAQSVYNELSEDGRLAEYNIHSYEPIKRKLDLLIIKHKPIVEYITSGEGIKLQYYDSLVIEQLINYFTIRKIPILTIHDSVVCEVDNANMVKEKMLELYANTVNKHIRIHILKNAKANNNAKLPHIKYQRSYSKVHNWQLIVGYNTKYTRQTYVVMNKISDNINVSRRLLNYFLREDTNIKIKYDARVNICRLNCKTYTRNQEYVTSGNIPYKRTIKINLDKLEGSVCINIIS